MNRWLKFGWLALLAAGSCLAQTVNVSGQVAITQNGHRGGGGAPNVAVWLTPVDATPPIPKQHFQLLQKNKTFDPRVLVIPVGSLVDFPNKDPFFHNVFSLFEGKKFDLGLYEAGTSKTLSFDRQGISYIFCNIHPEMSAVIIVVKTPYSAVSDKSGHITIPNVPAGNYQMEVWYEGASPETLASLKRDVRVSPDASSLGTLKVEAAKTLAMDHKNKYGRDYDKPAPENPVYIQP